MSTDEPDAASGASLPAATGASSDQGGGPDTPPVVDTRRYQRMLGAFAVALVVAILIYQFAAHGTGTAGVAAGKPLRFFSAPLAASTLNGDANLNPPCAPAHHDPRALNVCLATRRGPLVLAFFVTDSGACERQVDTLQAVSEQFAASRIQFAAVAVRGAHARTAAIARAHHWTIPVAYDRDGAAGSLYGATICPLIELARQGGMVIDRLIGEHWLNRAALAARVQALVSR